MKKSSLILAKYVLFFSVFIAACEKDAHDAGQAVQLSPKDYNSDVALEWMRFYLEIERFAPGYRPPVSARTLGYIGLAGYEAVVPGMPGYSPISKQYFGLLMPSIEEDAAYHWPTCLHNAYARMFEQFFQYAPEVHQQRLSSIKQRFNNRFSDEVPTAVFNRSKNYGEMVAQAVYDWSKTDAVGHQADFRNLDPSYVPPTGSGLWNPTYPDYIPALLPYWGLVRTFAADQDDNVPAPLPFSESTESELYVQAKEVMIKVNKIKTGNPAYYEDEWVARFWSDDCPTLTFTPAARWIAITNQLIEEKQVPLDFAVYAYAKIGMGLNDAGVRCWHEKYRYNVLRPIDFIRQVMGQSDWNTLMCPVNGNYHTPNFPAYPSGHAAFGAAAAEILTDLFGFDYPMVDRSHEGRTEFISTPRSFNNFYDMAEENAYSRIPLGVHYRMDIEAGLDLGYRIGKKINHLPWRK